MGDGVTRGFRNVSIGATLGYVGAVVLNEVFGFSPNIHSMSSPEFFVYSSTGVFSSSLFSYLHRAEFPHEHREKESKLGQ